MDSQKVTEQVPVVVIGAGPAGLTAAHDLAKRGVPVLVIEADQRVGGLSQTVEYKGFRFDIGGHRFFTKVDCVRELWRTMLGKDFIRRPRLSRILYDGKFFDYPLKPMNALTNLGIMRSIAILASYLWIRVRPIKQEESFEDWVTNRFGRRLYQTFFKTYTEKVWGIPCKTISARWAAQRIQGLSLMSAVVNMLFPKRNQKKGQTIKTLIDEFEYPRLGPGMMWEAFATEVERLGGRVILNAKVTSLVHDGQHVHTVRFEQNGVVTEQPAAHVISTMPLRHVVQKLSPPPPDDVLEAGSSLKYRDFMTVALIVDQKDVFPDNWIYIHDESVKVGRIQNFKNWSPDMVVDQSQTCLGLEYFCTMGDELWTLSRQQLIELGTKELGKIGLVDPAKVVDGTVIMVPKAYPIYDDHYAEAVKGSREFLERFENFQTIGRNGTHTYNNQDHSMVMAMLAARNYYFGEKHDLWSVNAEEEYHEVSRETENGVIGDDLRKLASTQPLVPSTLAMKVAFRPSAQAAD